MRHRVFTYITRQRELLVFDHVDQRHLAPQVPGGTIEAGESPPAAALREAEEETGLQRLYLAAQLAPPFEQDLRGFGADEVIVAWFFHLTTEEETPNRWRHLEETPSTGEGPIEFELYWVPINHIPPLGGIDGARLAALRSTFTP